MAELEATKNDINNRIRSIQWRDQIDCALASLRNDACYPEDSEAKLLKNVTDWLGGLKNATMCVFPECGSGYFEWSAFIQMRRELHNVQRIVMMDSHIKDDWLLPWREIARLSNVHLDVAKSYSDLADIIPCSCEVAVGTVVIVVYINGSFRFSPFYCGTKPEIEKSRQAAVKFWDWCTIHAINKPTNFLYTSVVEPCACSTWDALARGHEE
jgi:hypothetical protein